MSKIEPYLKFLAQVVATVLSGVLAASVDGKMTTSEWVNVVIAGLGAIGVLGAGNLPAGVWSRTKLYVAAATAGAVTLQTVLANGTDLGLSQWLQIGVAVLGALGVYAVKGPQVVPVAPYGRHATKE